MKLLLKSVFIISCFFLTACETMRQSEQDIRQGLQSFHQKKAQTLKNDMDVQKLKDKIWLDNLNTTPLSYYSNNTYALDHEKKSIERFAELEQVFAQERNSLILKSKMPLEDLVNMANAASYSLIIDLYNEKITYGQFATKRREIGINFDNALAERDRRDAEDQRARNDIASRNLQNYLINQNLINSLNQPARIVPFTCNRFGSMVTCQ